ncbi:CRISPR-associated endonuclease Cas2 [Desulforhopalus vacuolatus]|uniref:CRISPR-associated endonuclease Cas2 n=1 Tax=Desulforhopalus vacuolatus TaxID=40414 RepID=UPI001963CB05|nr:CRISPR-associated endonuclease Cas2 [Desulforhopalus vacuolatus]MBM9520562.1 CRISPR-associated endonuclease Cas2 [Desulforhopalus vacuolatus]
MRVIVTYDIREDSQGTKRRTKLHHFLRELGINTQKSVFECEVSGEELRVIRRYAERSLNLLEDRLRIYHLCSRCCSQAEVQGQGIKITQLQYQIF